VKSPKTYIMLLLAGTTVGGAILAWQQYGEIVELRAQAMNRDERADLQKRVWDLEKLNRELQDQLAAHRDPNDVDGLLAAAVEGERPQKEKDRTGRGERGGDPRGRGNSQMQQAIAVRELMNKPEVQAMVGLQQRAAIEARYATLFKNLNLPQEQIEKLKTLLAERSTTMQDVMAAAREQGINPRENPEAFQKLVANAQNEINNGIKAVIGEQGFAQLGTYEKTLPQRNLVNELQQRLSYTSTPLTPTQAEQMVQILANNALQRPTAAANSSGTPGGRPQGSRGGPPGSFGGRGGTDFGGVVAGVMGGGPGMGMVFGGTDAGRGGGAATVTPAAVAQSQTVLAPPQVAALQQIQQQQQAQQQLRQLVNDTIAANQPVKAKNDPGKPAGATTGTGTTGTPRKRGGGG
jgi:hypothetical protein